MTIHGTALGLKRFKNLSGVVIANLPEIDPDLSTEFEKNGEVVAMILPESLTRDNLERKLIALGKKQKPRPILDFVARRTLPARTVKFCPKDSYVANTKPGSHVKISYVDPEYLELCGEIVYEAAPEFTLCSHILTCVSAFAPAVEELNHNGISTQITPAEQFSLMEQRPDGPKSASGLLLANGYANLLEVIFPNGEKRLVRMHWSGDGWRIHVYSVSDSSQWGDERQVFSRDSRGTVAA